MPFRSILFAEAEACAGAEATVQPPFFPDLNLDLVVGAVTAGRDEYRLKPFFYTPLRDAAAVGYRHEVMRDLEQGGVLEPIRAFARRLRQMREHLAQAERLRHPLQQQAWFLDAAEIYCEAARTLAAELQAQQVRSRGLAGFRDHLAAYVGREPFRSLETDLRAVKAVLSGVRYTLRMQGARVTVGVYEGETDYGAEVKETFAKFERGAARSYGVKLRDVADMDHVEAQILDRVARLHPDAFGALNDFCASHRDFLDQTIARFDREVQFYVSYLEHMRRLAPAGLTFCYPQVSRRSTKTRVEAAFDLALADKLLAEGRAVVCNGFHLDDPERILVVTGPNNGGKTTFARMFGQLHHLAAIGLPVPGSRARLHLADRLLTHFEREEKIETLRGKLEDELLRVREILEQASPDSVIVMNESFSSTTLHDALLLGTEVIGRIAELGSIGVYVTFVDELASLSEATASMVATIDPEHPAARTYEIVRRPADGLAHAAAIAQKYGLTYERLKERIGS